MRSLFLVFVSIFLATAAFSQVPATIPISTQAKGYVLWPGDEVTGKVLGEPDYDFVATVNEDGNIEVPFFDKPVKAQCRTERDLRADVSTLLQKYLRAPQLSLRVTDRKSRPPANISGEVNQAQQVTLFRKVTLLEMLALAGDVKDEASGTIKIYRTQKPICEEDPSNYWGAPEGDPNGVPYKVFTTKDVKTARSEFNPTIFPGDNIIIQRAAPVYITGEVRNPQGVLIKDGGLSVYQAVAKLGGPGPQARTNAVKIYRQTREGKMEILSANFDKIKKGLEKDVMLEPYDVVEVDKAKPSVLKSIMQIAVGAAKNTVTSVTGGIGYRVMY